MKFRFKKNWWKYLLVGLLLVATLGGVIYGCFYASEHRKETKKISSATFALGALDDNGKYKETKESIYTKDAFECEGLKVTPKFESQVTYQIYFYDATGTFLEKTEILDKAYNGEIPFNGTHARIVITPNKKDNKAVKINVFTVAKYATQIKIEVNREQDNTLIEIMSGGNKAVLLGQGSFGDHFLSNPTMPWYIFSELDVSSANTVYIKLKTSSIGSKVRLEDETSDREAIIVIADDEALSMSVAQSSFTMDDVVITKGEFSFVKFDVSNFNHFVLMVDKANSETAEIYLR